MSKISFLHFSTHLTMKYSSTEGLLAIDMNDYYMDKLFEIALTLEAFTIILAIYHNDSISRT